MTAVSATALLRTAGLGMSLWTAAGAPDLFARLREHAAAQDRLAELAARTADLIGADLVPDPDLTVAHRRQALALRRALHRVSRASAAFLASLASGASSGSFGDRDLALLHAVAPLCDAALAAALRSVADLATALARAEQALTELVRAEHERLLGTPYALLTTSAAGRGCLADGTLDAASDVPARLAAGEAWSSKRMRRRSDYLWRMVARGATKTTPRGWLGQLSVVAVGSGPGVDLVDQVAVQRMSSVYEARRAGSTGVAELRWWFQPLHRMDGGQVQLWSLDLDDAGAANMVRVRATAPLLVLRAALRDGARSFHELAAAVLPPDAGDAERAALRVLLDRLTDLGVLQCGRSADRTLTPWGPPVRSAPAAYSDVLRPTVGAVPATAAHAWHDDLRQLFRLHRLFRTRPSSASVAAASVADSERPLLDVLADRFAEIVRDGPRPPAVLESHWPQPTDPDSGYAALVARLARGDTHLDAALLDSLGAPPADDCDPGWPLDCTLRPLPDGTAVFDTVQPAGVYDARFADAVHDLHGVPAHVADYQAFLHRLDAATGVESVELLVPPLVARAANSVRRPLYTTAWTGDPDLLTHCRAAGAARHLPLDELVLRIDGGTRTVLHRGRPIRPVYHATRYPSAPWNTLYGLLMAGSAQQHCRVRRLRHSLGALPDQPYLPRVTLGSLVLAPAQWRVSVSRLADLRSGGLAAARALDRLRADLGLPRWTFVSAGLGGKPVACDLESLRSVTVLLDAAAVSSADLIVEEMLPAPDQLTVHDPLDGTPSPVAAELLVRFGATTHQTSARTAKEHTPVGSALL